MGLSHALQSGRVSISTRIRLFHGETGEFIREVKGWTGLQVGFDLTGPVSGDTGLPYGHPCVSRSVLMAGGIPVFAEVDARGRGIQEVWFGRVDGIDVASGRGERSVALKGPEVWLGADDTVVRARETVTMTAGEFVRRLFADYPVDLKVDVGGQVYSGEARPIELAGQSVWGLLTDLADQTGEEFRFVAKPGEARLELLWTSPYAPLDLTPDRVIAEGRHVNWSYSAVVHTRAELAAAGRSFGAGLGVRGVKVKAVEGRVLGRKAALSAVIAEHGAYLFDQDGTGVTLDPSTGETIVLRMAATTQLRRWLTLRYPIVINIVDPDIWEGLRVGALVRVNFPSDDHGIYLDAVVRIQTLAFDLAEWTCEAGAELWEVIDGLG